MSARVKLRSVIVCCVALGPLGLGTASCGGGQPEAATAQVGNEGKAARLLQTARADNDIKAYRRLVTRFDHTAAKGFIQLWGLSAQIAEQLRRETGKE